MRYVNWDVLLFPEGSKIPIQEFKTDCHVLQDHEFPPSHGNPLLVPTITSFVPSLLAGTHFRVSLHCWTNPEPSRYLQSLTKHSDSVMFEARVYLDGKQCATKLLHRNGPWPAIIETGIELDRHGDFVALRFPTFHSEVLSQNYWNAGDDLGRIKIVISEGFPRDSLNLPFERIKNIVCFSFQHAPSDILESSAIAWPNASMWRIVPSSPYLSQAASPQVKSIVEDHCHSPRRQHSSLSQSAMPSAVTLAPGPTTFYKSIQYDPFTEPVVGRRYVSNSDTSMPDYVSYSTSSNSRQVSDPSYGKQDKRFETLSCAGAYDAVCESLLPAAPTNTPQGTKDKTVVCTASTKNISSALMSESVRKEVENESPKLSAVPGQIKSKKEGASSPSPAAVPEITTPGSGDPVQRKAPMPVVTLNSSGTKRQRTLTPASVKAIDPEDQPRDPPTLRKMSTARLGERLALGDISGNN